MTRRDVAHTAIGLLSLGLIGVGCWWIHPAAGMIAIGGLLLGGVVYARTRR